MSWVTNTMVLRRFALQAQDFDLELLPDHRVDGTERLVHQQDRRIGGERPSHSDALLLPAGQLRRVAVGQLRVEPDSLEHAEGGLAGGSGGIRP